MEYWIAKKTLEVAGSHSLTLDYESPCQRLHGHNWKITVYVRTRKLNDNGMVIDFAEIKRIVHGKLDHRNMNDLFEFNPTAENIAHWICNQIDGCFKVEVEESENNTAIYTTDES